MSIQIKRRREAATFLSSYTGAQGELLVDTTNNRVLVQDGSTLGGWPALGVSPATAVLGANALNVPHGSGIQIGCLEQAITCSGATSVSTAQIPNNAIVLGVSCFVNTAITGATSFNVDASTSSSGGVGGSAGQFGANIGIAAGANHVGVIGPTAWYAASTIKLTANGGSFTGGIVNIAIQYLVLNAPTS